MTNSSTRLRSLENGVEILVRGTVQGVGFRPFIFKLASRFNLKGSVTNTSDGVVIRARCHDDGIFSFIQAITDEAPPLARISSITHHPLPTPLQAESFEILVSETTQHSLATIPPDIALCDDCLNELLDHRDRRAGYPFINCTNCGPRFSIIQHIPYDRPQTSMDVFPLCAACEKEYRDPLDRRFHAQPNACAHCGPAISWHDRTGALIDCDDVVTAAVEALRDNFVVAIRGLGGYHLAVNGCSEKAVERLRSRKNRPTKPLAVMLADLSAVQRICRLSASEAAALTAFERPIVLLSPCPERTLADNLAPDISDIGVMLPYTPLHHLLFANSACPPALVMTSGNLSGEPICTSNEDALARLSGIADFFLMHNRDIVTRVDDSVVKEISGSPRLLRRSRGYVPAPILLPYQLPPLLSCGAGLKNTFSLARGNAVFPSQHIGDLFNISSYTFFSESVQNLSSLYEIDPVAVCCDLHPDYLSSHYARELNLPLYEVQHHHAHAVAVMAEHGLSNDTLAVVLDGTGYGTDGSIWGGEILRTGLNAFERLACLEPIPQPGGDAAVSEPWRMALSHLYRFSGEDAGSSALLKTIEQSRRHGVTQMLEKQFNSPLTSSCGRLFDAISALLGIKMISSFEGEAAMLLESYARKAAPPDWKDSLLLAQDNFSSIVYQEKTQRWEIIFCEFVKKMVDDITIGTDRSVIALQFHSWLIVCVSRLVEKLSGITGIKDVVLSGGCMQNGLLLEGLIFTLSEAGLNVYTGTEIPVNDGGISVGQAVIGGLRHVSRSSDES